MKQYEVKGNTVRSFEVEDREASKSTVVIQQRGRRNQLHLYRTENGQIKMEYDIDKSIIKPALRCIPDAIIDRICYAALIISLLFIFGTCYQCVEVDTSVATRLESIDRKRNELNELKLANEAVKSAIDSAVNPDLIYREATEVYGMVLPMDSEIITFEKESSNKGYVRTYDTIPAGYEKIESPVIVLANELAKLIG